MDAVRHLLRRHFFLLLGLLTLGLFVLVAALEGAGKHEAAASLAIPMRVLIIPIYLIWMVWAMLTVAIFGSAGWPGMIGMVFSSLGLVAGLAPYVLGDYLIRRWRETRARPTAR